LNVAAHSLNVLLSDSELAERRSKWVKPQPKYSRGYGALYSEHVTQAHEGCDFDFLGGSGETPEPEIH